MSKTITVSEADIQALRVATFTVKTGDAADDRAAAHAFQRLLSGLRIEREAKPIANVETPINVVIHNHGADVAASALRSSGRTERRSRARKN